VGKFFPHEKVFRFFVKPLLSVQEMSRYIAVSVMLGLMWPYQLTQRNCVRISAIFTLNWVTHDFSNCGLSSSGGLQCIVTGSPISQELLYSFEYKMSSNLRRKLFLNESFRGKKLETCTFLEFKTHLNFSTGKNMWNMHLIFKVIWYLKYRCINTQFW
jgi:hypothetical protein